MKIDQFRDEYAFLSNFCEEPLEYDGVRYRSAEAAFQAQKCIEREERLAFAELRPADAKRRGRRVALRPDWEQVKTGLMEEIVRAKFTQNPNLAAHLLDTGDAELLEGNTWNDRCWGVDLKTGVGENRLGKILMKVRAELREGKNAQ